MLAKLAMLPSSVIDNAKEILKTLEVSSSKENIMNKLYYRQKKKYDELRIFIDKINPYEVTPMEALQLLDEIKKISSK